MPDLTILNAPTTLLMPGLGEVIGTVTFQLELETPDADWRWRLLDRPGSRPLVLQFASTFPRGWAVERVTAWELPRWSEPFEERLRAAGSVEQVRAVLGGGVRKEWCLYEFDSQEDPEEEPEREPAWTSCELHEVPEALAEVAQGQAAELGKSLQVALDVSGFEPLLAASASGCYEHMGIGVIGWEALRIIGPVRFGGAEALLIAEMVIDETEDPTAAAVGWPSRLRIVPWTGVDQAEQAILSPDPGFRLPRLG